LGIVHELWQPLPNRFKDYIANPKSNGYQSLHTVVKFSDNKLIEIQIRTREQDHFAEDGIAAHWRYQGTEKDKSFDRRIAWLKQLLEWRASLTATNLIETLKLDLFANEIVAFTPKGDPITLREGATPIDFAYAVHTQVGNHCSRAIVNGKNVPLDYILKAGDIVEIITSKKSRPSRQWLNVVVSSKARSNIKSALNISIERDTKKKAKAEIMKDLSKLIEAENKGQIKISKCCNPQPGDPIVGFKTKDKKITVHKKDCPNIFSLDPRKEVKVRWIEIIKDKVIVRLTLEEKEAILTNILNYFVRANLKMVNINSRHSRENLFNLVLDIEDPDPDKLDEVINELRSLPEVKYVVVIR